VFRDDTNQHHDFVVVLGISPSVSNDGNKRSDHWHHIEAYRSDLDLRKLWKEHNPASTPGMVEENQYFYSDGSDGCLPILIRLYKKDVLNATIYETEIMATKVSRNTTQTTGRQPFLTESIEGRVSSLLQKTGARIKIRRASTSNESKPETTE